MDPQNVAAATPVDVGSPSTPPDGGQAPSQDTGPAPSVERRASRAPAAQGTAAQTQAPTPEPDYKAQYTGLQGVYRAEKAQYEQRLQAAQAAQAQADAARQRAEAAAWEQHWRLQGLSPETIRDNKAIMAERQRIENDKVAVAAERQRAQAEMAAFRQATEGPARRIIAEQIAAEHGIPVAKIIDLPHPDLMRRLAAEIKALGRTDALQTRRAAGTDRGESGCGGGVDFRKLSATEQIKMGLKAHHSQNARR